MNIAVVLVLLRSIASICELLADLPAQKKQHHAGARTSTHTWQPSNKARTVHTFIRADTVMCPRARTGVDPTGRAFFLLPRIQQAPDDRCPGVTRPFSGEKKWK